MRLKRHGPLFESTLRQVAGRRSAPSLCNGCRRHVSSSTYPQNIAVLGGGVSGLASAHFVSKEFPNSKITVYESGEETGGWIRSRRVDVPGGNALFEYGPRTLRPGTNAMPTAQLVQDLDLVDKVLYTKRNSPGARNRFLYYPDRLNRLPSGGEPPSLLHLLQLGQSGLLDGALKCLFEPWRPQRPTNITDESIGSFVARRADKRIVNNILSAVMHGIYAGDVWQLSAKTLLSGAWQLEGRYGSILRGLIRVNTDNPEPEPASLIHPYALETIIAMREELTLDGQFMAELSDSTMFSFRDGLQELVKALQRKINSNKQVKIRLHSPVTSYKLASNGGQQVEVVGGRGPSQTSENFDLVISTLRNDSLTPYVTVMTVNLFYSKPNMLPVQGFGYLIPQSVPFEQNPERALGVIFDSDAVTGQDTVSGTKLTVMLGGHWWNGWEHFPDKEEGLDLAKSILRRHLGITEEPAVSQVNLSRDCIPQYTVGYEGRVKEYASEVRDEFRGRVRVVGNQYNGVGVNDCIRGAWMMARGLRGNGWKERGTGLEKALDERAWVVAPMRQPMKVKTPEDARLERTRS